MTYLKTPRCCFQWYVRYGYPSNINSSKRVTSPVAKEIQKPRERESSDSKMLDHLLETDGLTKPASPKDIVKESYVNFTRQEIMFTGTPSTIKWVLQMGFAVSPLNTKSN